MRLFLKIAKYLYRLFILILVVLGFIYFIFSTTIGSRVILNALSQFIPGRLEIQRIEGALNSDIKLMNVRYSTNDIQIIIKSLHISWKPLQLLEKKIVINTFESTDVRINLINHPTKKLSSDSYDSLNLLAFLKYLTIHHLNVKTFLLSHENKILYTADEFSLTKKLAGPYLLTLKSSMGDVAGQFNLDWSPLFSWNITLNAAHISPSTLFESENSQANFFIFSSGTWGRENKRMNLKIDNISGKIHRFPLRGFAEIHFDNGALQIQNSYLTVANAKATMSGSIKKTWNLQWQLTIPQLNKILLNSSGTLSASGDMLGTLENLHTEVRMRANHITLFNAKISDLAGNISARLTPQKNALLNLTASDIKINDFRIPQLNINILSKLTHEQLISQVTIALSPSNQLHSNIFFPNFLETPFASQPVTGNINIKFAKLNELLSENPAIKNPNGNLQGTINIVGTILNPNFSFNMLLKDGHTFIPKLGTTLHSLSIQSTYQSHHPMMFQGSFEVGRGKANFNAAVDIDQPGFPSTLTLDGDNLQLVNLKEYKIDVSPKLNVTYDKNKLEIQGKIDIPNAELKPTDFSTVVTLPDEVVFDNQAQSETFIPANLAMNIHITLGNHIYLSYENLDTTLNGAVQIQQIQGSLPTAMGELNIINGKYRAYGNFLKIKEGRLIYNGNTLTNPGLDIRAFKKIKTISFDGKSQYINNDQLSSVYTGSSLVKVGIWVKGTLNHPDISLYSDPAGISQRDILSYLVFGYPQSQISSASALALLNNIGGGTSGGSKGLAGKVTDKVQNFLDLSELDIGSTEYFNPNDNSSGNTTTVNIGKKLGKKLSLHYTIGFFQPVQILSLKYLLNKYFTVQSESSTIENGADIFYEIERD